MDKTFKDFVYNVENLVSDMVIALLSVGVIVVSIYSLFFSSQNVDFVEFGRIISPWIGMVALMIIARELWILNNQFGKFLEMKGDE